MTMTEPPLKVYPQYCPICKVEYAVWLDSLFTLIDDSSFCPRCGATYSLAQPNYTQEYVETKLPDSTEDKL